MILETKRLILRRFRESDAKDLYDYLSAPTVSCFMCMKLDTPEDAAAEAKKRAQKNDELYFAICLKENEKVIGELFAGIGEDSDTYSPCWMLHPDYQGKGYAYEAVHKYFDYLFIEKRARRLYAYTEDYNLSSQKLCEKLGMRREGLFMEFVSFVTDSDGMPIYENTVQYAILKKEWESIKR